MYDDLSHFHLCGFWNYFGITDTIEFVSKLNLDFEEGDITSDESFSPLLFSKYAFKLNSSSPD